MAERGQVMVIWIGVKGRYCRRVFESGSWVVEQSFGLSGCGLSGLGERDEVVEGVRGDGAVWADIVVVCRVRLSEIRSENAPVGDCKLRSCRVMSPLLLVNRSESKLIAVAVIGPGWMDKLVELLPLEGSRLRHRSESACRSSCSNVLLFLG